MAEYKIFEKMTKEEFIEVDSFLYHQKLRMMGREEPVEEYNKFLSSLASFAYDYKKLSDRQIESLYHSAIQSDKDEFKTLIPLFIRVMKRVNYSFSQPVIIGYHKETKGYTRSFIIVCFEGKNDLRQEVWCKRAPKRGEKITFYSHPKNENLDQEGFVTKVSGEKVYISYNLERVLDK